jgi:FkbM family methyltransferase
MAHNGERRILDHFLALCDRADPVILDIGAHTGGWAAILLARRPEAQVFCFELVPDIHEKLAARFAGTPNVSTFAFGLSSRDRRLSAAYDRRHPTTSALRHTAVPHLACDLAEVEAEVRRGDAVVTQLGLDRIDAIKIDVEGHEVDVLAGLEATLTRGPAPRIIQFEYGYTYLASHRTLRDVYDILEPAGYAIGRIYPETVEFKAYELADDHFRMGNYVAVKREDDPLLDALRN